MKTLVRLALLTVALALPFRTASADVNLTFNLANVSVEAGGFFDVTVSLQVTGAEQVNSVNYFLQTLTNSGLFIISRSVTGSAFSDTYFTDAQVASNGDAQNPAGADNALNMRNDYDLGATTESGFGTGLLATYRIGVTNQGNFTLTTTTATGIGWGGTGGASSGENPFNNHASMSVQVVPEPSTWALLATTGIAAIAGMRLRRRAR